LWALWLENENTNLKRSFKMIVDAQLLFSDEQAVTAAAGSTNTIDLSAVRNIGVGENLYVVVVCTTAMTDTGSDSTLAVALEGDSTTTFTPDSTKTLFTFSALSAAGTTKIAKLSPDDINLRYARLKYTPGGGDLTTGSFTAFITKDVQAYTSYADNITIS
jgi:hypothetical protein